MMATLTATCGVSAILVGVIVALGMIEQRLAPGGRRLELATWPDASPPRRCPIR